VKSRHILLDNPIKESKRRKAQNEKKRRVQVAKEKKVARGDIIGTREAKKRRLWNFNESQAKYVFTGCDLV
jgi:ABC-type tungstate transport system permease subunit